jgi:thioredoxin 1
MSLPITSDNAFAADVLASPGPILVDFTADWCPPCKMIAPVLEQIAEEEADRLRVVSIDVDENPVTALHYGILSMPTLALFVGGQVVAQFVGAKPRIAIMRELEPHLAPAKV